MKRISILILTLAVALPAATAALACGDSSNAENLVVTPDVRSAISSAYAAQTGLAAAAVPGRTYYGYHVGIRYAVATFAPRGRAAYPAIFSDGGTGHWRLLRITHGAICSGVVPVDLIQTWSLSHWRGGCYVEPTAV
jgi:hypothetical protein